MTGYVKEPKTLQEAITYFSDLDNCLAYLAKKRWPDGVVICPTCGGKQVHYLSTRRLWQCVNEHKRRQFSIKVGTIMEDSAIGLDKWLAAMWMICNDKNGISSYELHRCLGVTQKSAWFMAHRIRLSLHKEPLGKLSGHVEADETFIGGKARFMHKDKRERINRRGFGGKTVVVGILERGGEVRTEVTPDRERNTLQALVRQHVQPGSYLSTDDCKSYWGLHADYIHQIVDHAETYVSGQVHTNGMENFWSLFKRGIKGTYVSVEPFHLYRYLDEQMFRFNNRATKKQFIGDGDRFRMAVSQICDKRLTYDQLTGRRAEQP
ncbi:MAG: IS1595 family transposase [Acidobacteriia bacterium]|nr:IS1595 family transposase [Terriglobia bacterium]